MSTEDRAALIARYREGAAELAAATTGLTDADLDAPAPPGEWTVREIVHHTADSELTSAVRLRRLLAEENPLIHGYDQEEFARRLHYRERPIGPALEAVRAARESCVSLLEVLDEAEWHRSGTHSESGRYSVGDWLRIYAGHCHDHVEQIRVTLGRR